MHAFSLFLESTTNVETPFRLIGHIRSPSHAPPPLIPGALACLLFATSASAATVTISNAMRSLTFNGYSFNFSVSIPSDDGLMVARFPFSTFASFDPRQISPEPSSGLLATVGLISLLATRRRR
jgi:hypothetical protein